MKKATKTTAKFDFRTIRSFEDACKKENIDPIALPEVSMIPEEFRKALIAAYKLFIIFKAINNGWVADFTNSNQGKYYPYLWVLSSGFRFVFSNYDYVNTGTIVGSRLCTFSSEAAIYIGQQFGVDGSEYKDFFLNQK